MSMQENTLKPVVFYDPDICEQLSNTLVNLVSLHTNDQMVK